VKYSKASVNENSLRFMKCLEEQNRNEKFIILSVNTDFINNNEKKNTKYNNQHKQ